MTIIALIGASGNIGTCILDEALARGHQVIGVVRNIERVEPRNGLTLVQGDVVEPSAIASALNHAEVLVVSMRWTVDAANIVTLAQQAKIDRLIAVVGAGSLDAGDGQRVLDTPDFPSAWRPGSEAAARALDVLRNEATIDWVAVSPSLNINPGERTGQFRLGGDTLLRDESGESRISREDFALAILDEIERPQHHRERFTVGY